MAAPDHGQPWASALRGVSRGNASLAPNFLNPSPVPDPQLGSHHGAGVGEAPQPAQQPRGRQSHDVQVDIRGHHDGPLQKPHHLVDTRAGRSPWKRPEEKTGDAQAGPEADREHRLWRHRRPPRGCRNLKTETHSRNTCRAGGGGGRCE